MNNEMPCGDGTLRITVVRIWHQVSCRAFVEVSTALKVSCSSAPRSWQCHDSTIQIVNLVAFWMYLHRSRCFLVHVRMLFQSLRARSKAPGGAGSIWKYLDLLLRATGVSGRFVYGFQTELHIADEAKILELSTG
jgi:hypothetical protein